MQNMHEQCLLYRGIEGSLFYVSFFGKKQVIDIDYASRNNIKRVYPYERFIK